MKGYQLIETEILESLHSISPCNETLIGILLWITHKIKNKKISEIEVELIIANSHGNKYPTLAIHYINDTSKNMETIVSSSIEKLINEFNFFDYVNFISSHKKVIKNFTTQL